MIASDAIRSQYLAALKMLKEAILKCPPSVWDAPQDKDKFWSKVRHTLRYAHRDVRAGLPGFVAWKGQSWADVHGRRSKPEVLEFLDFIEKQVAGRGSRSAAAGFRPDKLERMIAGIRHIQQHTGELFERLGTRENITLHWTEHVHRSHE
jgi:hypothetical protein